MKVIGLITIGQLYFCTAVIRVLDVAVCADATIIIKGSGQRIRYLELKRLAGSLINRNLERIVSAVPHALIKPLRQHIRERLSRSNRTRTGNSDVLHGSPVEVSSYGADVIDIQNRIRWELAFDTEVPLVHVWRLKVWIYHPLAHLRKSGGRIDQATRAAKI